VLVIDRDLLWGGYLGVMAIMAEAPRFSQTRIIVTAVENPGEELMSVNCFRRGSIRCALGNRAAPVRKRVSGYFVMNSAS